MNAARAGVHAAAVSLSILACLAPASGQVRTIAGSGLGGFQAGAAVDAQFMMPTGIATGTQDDVFIADSAAQRIFRLTIDGVVQTVAGSGAAAVNGVYVAGGYRDGIAAVAQFNHPSAVAVGTDGIYVADMANHCIRLIAHGSVTTFAGSPKRTGAVDGDRLTASFSYPRGLLFDNGVLYVADASVGIRLISPSGTVSTLPLPAAFDRRVTSMAFVGTGTTRKLIVANVKGFIALDSNLAVLWQRRIRPRFTDALYDDSGNLIKNSLRANRDPIGLPFAIVAMGDHQIAYVDPYIHAVRTLDVSSASGASAILNMVSPDAPYGGGYADGPTPASLFDSPMGIARSSDGGLIIADTANRRIRRVDDPQRDPPISTPSVADPRLRLKDYGGRNVTVPKQMVPLFDRGAYRISYLGNSFVYWNTRWNESIPGLLERRLRADAPSIGLRRRPEVAVIHILPTFQAIEGYTNFMLNLGATDCVVVQLNSGHVFESYPIGTQSFSQYSASTRTKIIASVRRIYRTLSAHGIPVVFVLQPEPEELTPLESMAASWQDLVPNRAAGYYSLGFQEFNPPSPTSLLAAVLNEAKVPLIDLTSDFSSAEQSANRVPLVGTRDYHLTLTGRRLVADGAAAGIERLHPWTTSSPR